jgi:hypothetical protein
VHSKILNGTCHYSDASRPTGRSRLSDQKQLLITDNTPCDGHQIFCSPRAVINRYDPCQPTYAANMSGLFSMECWGGATFDGLNFGVNVRGGSACATSVRPPNITRKCCCAYQRRRYNQLSRSTCGTCPRRIRRRCIFAGLTAPTVENMRVAIDAVHY